MVEEGGVGGLFSQWDVKHGMGTLPNKKAFTKQRSREEILLVKACWTMHRLLSKLLQPAISLFMGTPRAGGPGEDRNFHISA